MLSAAPSAGAAGPPAAELARRKEASDLADKGAELFEQKSWEAALGQFRAAYEKLPSPIIALYQARTLVKLGRLVEADEAYGRAETFVLPLGSSAASRLAVNEAREEAAALRLRIPRLAVVAREGDGTDTTSAALRVDGKLLAPTEVGIERIIDPGVHRIEGSRGDELWLTETVTLREGERRLVTLLPVGKPVPETMVTVPPAAPVAPPPKPSTTRRTVGIVALGVGAVGVATGVTAGFIMLSQKSDLTETCAGKVCPPAVHGDLDLYRRTRTVSNIGYGVGLVGLGVGAVLLLSGKPDETKSARRLTPFATSSTAGFQGVF